MDYYYTEEFFIPHDGEYWNQEVKYRKFQLKIKEEDFLKLKDAAKKKKMHMPYFLLYLVDNIDKIKNIETFNENIL